jgi:endonuclease/exonuclease/phosphatase family metal-dependent hydrolase
MSTPIHPFVFDPVRGAWVEDGEPPASAEPPSALTVVTWNTWFASYAFEARFRALLGVARTQRPDVICLQEITSASLKMLLTEPWIREGYRISDAAGDTFDSYGVVILSRLPVRSLVLHELPSHMGRRLLIAELAAGPRRLVVGTVHLESLKHNPDLRAEQLAIIFPLLRAAGPDAVLVGDFNFCSSWPEENANLDPEFTDLWPALRGREPGYTEDTRVNVMLSNVKPKAKTVRFDRVLLRSAGGAWRARSIALLGTEPISDEAPDTFPSDHFGLVAVIEAVPGK